MVSSSAAAVALSAFIAAGSGVIAFSPSILHSTKTSSSSSSSSSTKLSMSTVDPTVITKKEYQDICGVDFSDATLAERLSRTAYLYPKHVEVIDDFAPMVDKMVDEIVSYIDVYTIMCPVCCVTAFPTMPFLHLVCEIYILQRYPKHSLSHLFFFALYSLSSSRLIRLLPPPHLSSLSRYLRLLIIHNNTPPRHTAP